MRVNNTTEILLLKQKASKVNQENLLAHLISIRNGFLQYMHELNVSCKESEFYVRCSRCKQEFRCLPILLSSHLGIRLTMSSRSYCMARNIATQRVLGLRLEPGSCQPRQMLVESSELQVLYEAGVIQCCSHPFPQLPVRHWNPAVMQAEH